MATGTGNRGFAPLGKKPAGITRLIFRARIHLYRLHLGWLFVHRFLLLLHQGRKTGRVRRTVLEVLRYDPAGEESVVASAGGEKADWYRNIRSVEALEVHTAGKSYVPEQRFLNGDQAYSEILNYERRHPWALRLIARSLGSRFDGTERTRRSFAESVRMVAFRPGAEGSGEWGRG